MKYLTLVLFIALTLDCFSQETKFVLKKSSDYNEEYYVLKQDKTHKQGPYVKYKVGFVSGIIILESGEYIKGQKNGTWEYFHDDPTKALRNALKERGNYANGKRNGIWTTYYMDTVPDIVSRTSFGDKRKIDSVSLTINQQAPKLKTAGMYLNDKRVGEWISFDYMGAMAQKYNFTTSHLSFDGTIKDSLQYNTNRKPLFIGGLHCLLNFLYENVEVSEILEKINIDSTYADITFAINEQGRVKDINLISNNYRKSFREEIIRLISTTDFNWLPGLKDGVKISCIYKIRLDIISVKDDRDFQPIRFRFLVLD